MNAIAFRRSLLRTAFHLLLIPCLSIPVVRAHHELTPPEYQPLSAPVPGGGCGGDIRVGDDCILKRPSPDNCAGDPVDCVSGLFIHEKTDLRVEAVIPLKLTRVYRPDDQRWFIHGLGMNHMYNIELRFDNANNAVAFLALPDGGSVHFTLTSAATANPLQYVHTASPGTFHGARLTRIPGGNSTLRLANGTSFDFRRGYDGSGAWLTALTDRNGNLVTFTMDAIGLTYGIGGRFIRVEFESAYGYASLARDNMGRTVRYAYDARRRLWKVTDPEGGVEEYGYDDDSDRMIWVKDPRGNFMVRNTYGRFFYPCGGGTCYRTMVSLQTFADNTTTRFNYVLNSSGRSAQTDVTDARGYVTRMTFNTSGYMTSKTLALGTSLQQTTTFERDGSGRMTAMVDALGRRTAFDYDADGNVLRKTYLAGTAQAVGNSYTYDATFGKMTSITDPLTRISRLGFDAKGNATSITNPLNASVSATFNAAGQPLTMRDPLQQPTTLSYDASGDATQATDPLGRAISMTYDATGRTQTITDPLGNPVSFEWDQLGRVKTTTDPLGATNRATYDGNGNRISFWDAKNNLHAFAYDARNRLINTTDPLGRIESYIYDGNGNLIQATDRKGQVSSFTYDALNRVQRRTYHDGSTVTYSWDAGNRIVTIADSVNGTVSRNYDGLDRLTQETTPQGTITYSYDAAGRRTQMQVGSQTPVTYTWYNDDSLSRMSTTNGGNEVTFGYDAAGRPTMVRLPNQWEMKYYYDAAGQLTTISYFNQAGVSQGYLSYSYDANGRRTGVTGPLARATTPETASFAYDGANRLIQWKGRTVIHDVNGNMLSDGVTSYTWNSRNQLVGAVSPGISMTITYDALGRRRSVTTNGVTQAFVHDGENVAQTTSGVNVFNMLMGLGLDQVYARIAASDPYNRTSYLTDALGSTTTLMQNSYDVGGTYTYEPYGSVARSGTVDTPFQYTGQERDASGLNYLRTRYYHPALARFISEDTIGLAGGQNLYSYAMGNPISMSDPTGEILPIVILAIGVAASGTVGGVTAAANGDSVVKGTAIGLATGLGGGLPALGLRTALRSTVLNPVRLSDRFVGVSVTGVGGLSAVTAGGLGRVAMEEWSGRNATDCHQLAGMLQGGANALGAIGAMRTIQGVWRGILMSKDGKTAAKVATVGGSAGVTTNQALKDMCERLCKP